MPKSTEDSTTPGDNESGVVSMDAKRKKEAPQELSQEDQERLQKLAAERDVASWTQWLLRPEKKVAIVGFTSSRHEAPWGDPTWEKWIVNNLHLHLKPEQVWDRLYDLHDEKTILSDKTHEAFLRECDKPVFVWKPRDEWPSALAYPREEIVNAMGRYINNSISWCVAHAMFEGATHISVFGVDMAQGGDPGGNGEYARQRPSCEYFLGLAVGRGIKVYVPPSSDLLKVASLYGVENDDFIWNKLSVREKELVERLTNINNQLQQSQIHAAQLQGALEQTRYSKAVFTNPRANREGKDPIAEEVE